METGPSVNQQQPVGVLSLPRVGPGQWADAAEERRPDADQPWFDSLAAAGCPEALLPTSLGGPCGGAGREPIENLLLR
ncbi:hypothetical protein NDU88_002545 [Pleurodeles waltl]|uniref:Uncharacterized protein n=1 Tax=Pleurodeles waltl TaxID=8319 RepID=A0AAV7MS10_PLEWA|nr:hypothetical protein NDU88_002545 [Pleurodeles waltl]